MFIKKNAIFKSIDFLKRIYHSKNISKMYNWIRWLEVLITQMKLVGHIVKGEN